MRLDELVSRIRAVLGIEPHVIATGPDAVHKVGILTGGGGTWIDRAATIGCDTYITGEGGIFTRMFAKECEMNLIFGTHQATEAPGIKGIGQLVSDHAQVPWEFIAESPDVF